MFKKILITGVELDRAEELLRQTGNGENNSEFKFLQGWLNRARQLRQRATRIFNTCPP